MLTTKQAYELGRCYADPSYFVENFCRIYDSVESAWIPFALWPAQQESLGIIHDNRLIIILKARQIGLSWVCMAYALWQIIFRPIASVGIFSRRDNEALYLLSQDRLRGMYEQLPDWLKTGHDVTINSGHEWALKNGSVARAFPTSAGDSYVNTLAIVDEADLAPDLNRLMRAVKPTVDNGGKLILLSRSDKTQPASEFKAIYRGAEAGENGWSPIFLPWHVHPGRDASWYEAQKKDIESRTGSLDDLHEQYPSTPAEALAPRSLDKRLPHDWLTACYDARKAISRTDLALPGMAIYALPVTGRRYVVGVDAAEGNPTSDESSITVLDVLSGEEMACCAGRFEPSATGHYADAIAKFYNRAAILVERNNHGHAVILYLREHSEMLLLVGRDGNVGWLTNAVGKALMYSEAADALRDKQVLIHSLETYTQLASIEGSTLSAPVGMHDDRAVSWVLAQVGRAAAAGLSPSELLGAFAWR